MSYRPRPRLWTRHLKNKCALCKETASRFRDIGPGAESIFGAGLSLFWPLVDGSRTWIARFRLGNQ